MNTQTRPCCWGRFFITILPEQGGDDSRDLFKLFGFIYEMCRAQFLTIPPIKAVYLVGEHDNGGAGMVAFNIPQQIQAAPAWQADIEQDDIRA